MIRPEAKAQLYRWREVLVGGVALLIGLLWLSGSSQLLLLPGVAFALGGAALIWVGVQRARFRGEGQGPGSVQVDEGQITYFGPLTGGVVDLRELTQIVLDHGLYPAHWRMRQAGAHDLLIPVNAEGADGLFDAFATLPGMRMELALAALKSHEQQPIVIWRRELSITARLSGH